MSEEIEIGNAPDKRTQSKHTSMAPVARAMAQEQRQAVTSDMTDRVALKTYFPNSGTVEEGFEREKIIDRVGKLSCIRLAR